MEQITEEGLYNYATTTGALYEKHCGMARAGATIKRWYWWTRIDVQRAWTNEQSNMTPLRDEDALWRAAGRLKEYYEKHVAENE